MDGLDLRLDAGRVAAHGHVKRSRLGARIRRNLPFLGIVVLPTLVSTIYFLAFASPQYVSEAQFVVRGQGPQPTGMLSSLLATTGGAPSTASEDTYAVQDYIMSRDAASDLIQHQDLKAVFDRPGADFIARFPSFFRGTSFESFFHYYQKHVQAELDTTTGLSTLTVRTFNAVDSQRIARALLTDAERLINRMNERQRENTIAAARNEVVETQDLLRHQSAEIARYRDQVAMLDPNRQSVPMLRDINDLQTMLTTTKIQISQLKASAPNSPLLPVYQRRVAALQAQIAASSAGITGSETSLVPKITGYEDLTLQRDLTEKQLANAMTALEAAKNQANRQLVYLDEVTQPNRPDYAAYPRSLASIAIVFATMMGLFLMGRLIISGAREHQIF